MEVRKITADRIFDGYTWWPAGTTLVLSADGTIIELTMDPEPSAEKWKGILCPGFVNAHCHLELSHLKGQIPTGTGMVDFLLHVMFNRQAEPSLIQYCMQSAVEEMIGNGIVAVGDISNTTDSITLKHESPLLWHQFVEVTGFAPAAAKARFDNAVHTAETFARVLGNHRVSIVPHAPYSVSGALFELIQNHAQLVASMHNQESVAEEQFIANKQGSLLRLFEAIGLQPDFFEAQHKSSLQYTTQMLPSARRMLLVHNCHTRAEDVAWLFEAYSADTGRFHFCLCPGANAYIGNPLPNLPMLLQFTPQICLGTDSLASNKQLSLLAEMALLQQAWPQVPPETLLQMATSRGAQALHLQQQVGSFERGKKPGVLLLEGLEPAMQFAAASVQRLA